MRRRLLAAEPLKRLTVRALLLFGMAVLVGGAAALLYYASLPYAGFEFVARQTLAPSSRQPGRPGPACGRRPGAVDRRPAPDACMAYLQPNQKLLRLIVSRDGQTIPQRSTWPRRRSSTVSTHRPLSDRAGFLANRHGCAPLQPQDSRSRFFVLVTLLGRSSIALWSIADLGLAWANC